MAELAVCPFCGFKGDGPYVIQLHIEEHHTEDSPFIVNDSVPAAPKPAASSRSGSEIPNSESATPSEENPWVKCTRPACGEYVLISDIDEHLDLHEATATSEEDTGKPIGRLNPVSSTTTMSEKDRESLRASNEYYSNERSPRKPSHRSSEMRNDRRSPQKSPRFSRPSSSYSNTAPRSRGGRSLFEYFSGTSYHGSAPPPLPKRRQIQEPREPGRLGKKELGPYAFEKAMPADVRRHLLYDAEPSTNRIGRDGRLYRESLGDNETSGLIPILADLCAHDPSTVATYFCDPSNRHVVKIRCDGNFCGFWNIQMLLTYIHDQAARKSNTRPQPLPNVLQIQDIIEQAWDAGICAYGRIETGGVRGTRKWIGTHEALAFFTQIGVQVEALSFKEEENDSSAQSAVLQLLDHIEAYFISGLEGSRQNNTSHITSLPPVYFQRFGHSMTIVGLERKADGSRNLLVFDPSFATAGPMGRVLAGRKANASVEAMLRPYRRSDVGLGRWEEFEVVVPKPATQGR